MKKITANKFKERCPAILEQVDAEGIVITKNGKPVAKLIPAGNGPAEWIGSMKDKIKVKGNIFSTGLRWDAES